MFVYRDEIAAWRKILKLRDDQTILISFSWSSDEDLRMARLFPEHMACDTIFGVTRKHRDMFVVAGINGHNKLFTAMRCFMPSKETKACQWAMITVLRHLVTDTIL